MLRLVRGNMTVEEGFSAIYKINHHGILVPGQYLYHILNECNSKKDFEAGKLLYALLTFDGLESVSLFGDHIIRLFCEVGYIEDVNAVFRSVYKPTMYTWNAIISANIKHGRFEDALDFYSSMPKEGFMPNTFIFCSALKASTQLHSLHRGNIVYDQMLKCGVESDTSSANALIDLYFHCGNANAGRKVFDTLQKPDVVSWTSMIAGYIQHSYPLDALELFEDMQKQDIQPNKVTFLHTLRACAILGALWRVRVVHNCIIKNNIESEIAIKNMLANVYDKLGCLEEAEWLFKKLPETDAVSWSLILSSCTENGQNGSGRRYLYELQREGIIPNKSVFLSLLKICVKQQVPGIGKWVHDIMVRSSFELDRDIQTALVNMYSKCQCLHEAHSIFNKMSNKDESSWGSLICGYVQQGNNIQALELFQRMQREGFMLNSFITSCSLKACCDTRSISYGRLIHFLAVENTLEYDVVIGNAIIDMYGKCGCLIDAHKVFDCLENRNIISWGSIISVYVQHGDGHRALDLFGKMEEEGLQTNSVTLSSVIKACGSIQAVVHGMLLHDKVIRCGFYSNLVVANTLIDMYMSFEWLQEAEKAFLMLPNRDVVSWGTLIYGYAQHGNWNYAIQYFKQMQAEGFTANKVTFLGVLKVFGHMGDIEKGQLLHDQIIQAGMESDIDISSTLTEMYHKCGSLPDMHKVFDQIDSPDGILWGIMSSAYAYYGMWDKASGCLEEMKGEGVEYPEIVYSKVMSELSHAGELSEAQQFFQSMGVNSCVAFADNYNSIADLFGRAGSLKDAKYMLETMPAIPDVIGWMSLLTACTMYGALDVGKDCLDKLAWLNSNTASRYVLMSKLYADKHQPNDVGNLRTCLSAWENPGQAWIEVDNNAPRDTQNSTICLLFKRLIGRLRLEGLVPFLESQQTFNCNKNVSTFTSFEDESLAHKKFLYDSK